MCLCELEIIYQFSIGCCLCADIASLYTGANDCAEQWVVFVCIRCDLSCMILVRRVGVVSDFACASYHIRSNLSRPCLSYEMPQMMACQWIHSHTYFEVTFADHGLELRHYRNGHSEYENYLNQVYGFSRLRSQVFYWWTCSISRMPCDGTFESEPLRIEDLFMLQWISINK